MHVVYDMKGNLHQKKERKERRGKEKLLTTEFESNGEDNLVGKIQMTNMGRGMNPKWRDIWE